MDDKHISPKVLVFGFFFLAFCLFLLFAEPGDYMTGQVAGENINKLVGSDISFGSGPVVVSSVISVPINFKVDEGDSWPIDYNVELIAKKGQEEVGKKVVSLEHFFSFALLDGEAPVVILNEDGTESFRVPGDYVSNSQAFDLKFNELCDEDCKLIFNVYNSENSLVNGPFTSDDIVVLSGEDYSDVEGLPYVSFLFFANLDELEGLSENEDLDDLVNEFKSGDKLVCFAEFYNGDLISGVLSDSENDIVGFENSSFDWDICVDENDNLIDNCNMALSFYDVSEGLAGDWSCEVEICNSVGCSTKVSNVMEKLGGGPKIVKDLPTIVLVDGRVQEVNGEKYDIDDYVEDPDGDKLSYTLVGDVVGVIKQNGELVSLNKVGSSLKIKVSDGSYDLILDIPVQGGSVVVPGYEPPVQSSNEGYNTGYQGYTGNEQTGATGDPYGGSSGLQKSKISNLEIVLVLVGAIFGAIFLGFWLWMLIDAITQKDYENRIVWIIIIIFLNLLGAVVYFFLVRGKRGKVEEEGEKKEVKSVEEKKEVKPVESKTPVNDPLENYVNEMLTKGHKIEQIKEVCVKAGWDKVKVDKVCRVLNLKTFVKEQLNKGFDKEKLKGSLIAKGWPKNLVEEVFSKV